MLLEFSTTKYRLSCGPSCASAWRWLDMECYCIPLVVCWCVSSIAIMGIYVFALELRFHYICEGIVDHFYAQFGAAPASLRLLALLSCIWRWLLEVQAPTGSPHAAWFALFGLHVLRVLGHCPLAVPLPCAVLLYCRHCSPRWCPVWCGGVVQFHNARLPSSFSSNWLLKSWFTVTTLLKELDVQTEI